MCRCLRSSDSRAQVKVLENRRDTLIASNKSLAEFNLSREPAYRQARQALADAHRAAQELRREVEAKREQLSALSRQTSLDTTLALLQMAAAEADEESERIANHFLSGQLPVEAFLSQFIASRKTAHLRRIKTEKLDEYVKRRPSSEGAMRPAPPPPQQPPPYPTSFPFSRPTYP